MFTLENFYKSREWEKFRKIIIDERTNADGYVICERCGKPIYKKYDCIAHHKIELTEENVNDYSVSLNPENIELIHFRCHNEEHRRFGGFSQRVFLIYGSPCSGKTTFVKANAQPDDLILDMDSIWECISVSDRYHKPNRLKQNVFGIRDCIIDQIRTRLGMWRDCYIVGGYPLRTDRDRLCDMLRAEPIFIEESKEVCLARCEDEKWKQFVEDWFDDYVP